MVLQSPLLAPLPWLVHGFSTRLGGVSSFLSSRYRLAKGQDLNLAKVKGDSAQNVEENRRRLLARLAAEPMRLVTLEPIHSDLIRVVDSSFPAIGDGLATDRPGLLLSVLVADCLPILLVDIKQRVVAALHCG